VSFSVLATWQKICTSEVGQEMVVIKNRMLVDCCVRVASFCTPGSMRDTGDKCPMRNRTGVEIQTD
jgi:hypothetical protein